VKVFEVTVDGVIPVPSGIGLSVPGDFGFAAQGVAAVLDGGVGEGGGFDFSGTVTALRVIGEGGGMRGSVGF